MLSLKSVLLFVIGLALSVSAFAGVPISAGPQSNPAANTIMADSGPITDANHHITIYAGCTVACVMVVELRDPTNTTTVWQQYMPIPANDMKLMDVESFTVPVFNDRVRVRINAAITGAAQVSMIVD